MNPGGVTRCHRLPHYADPRFGDVPLRLLYFLRRDAGSPQTLTSLASKDANRLQISAFSSRAIWYGSMLGVPANAAQLKIAYSGLNSASCTQTISIYNWTTARWVTLDTRTVGTTEIDVTGLVPPGSQSDYIKAGTGEVRVQIQSTFSGAFTTSGDLLALSY